MQWLAVRTLSALKIIQPQEWEPAKRIEHCHGNSLMSASRPPITRDSIPVMGVAERLGRPSTWNSVYMHSDQSHVNKLIHSFFSVIDNSYAVAYSRPRRSGKNILTSKLLLYVIKFSGTAIFPWVQNEYGVKSNVHHFYLSIFKNPGI